MGTLKDGKDSLKNVAKTDMNIKFTPKGNRLIEFKKVSDEERKRLRIDAYEYIL
ncbi:Hypothetical protein PEIBARAKI_5336 [Petrimonas sp. IBARAKI]|nr:Hypothetical protein PEIBARAKI_5336 [Petrimonas sp. IBARAKI]